jgi:hypothetical protein
MRVSFLLVPLVMVPLVSSQAQTMKDCDLKTICAGVQPGGGRMMECLKEHRYSLSDQCLLAIGRQFVGLKPGEKQQEAAPSAAPSAPAAPAAPATPDASSAPATSAAPANPDASSAPAAPPPTTTDQPPK